MSDFCRKCLDCDYLQDGLCVCGCHDRHKLWKAQSKTQSIAAELAACREERDAFIAANKRCCDGIISMTAEIQAYKEALMEILCNTDGEIREIALQALTQSNPPKAEK